jgi:hypothetical protein
MVGGEEILRICTGDGFEEGDEGSRILYEVSEFKAKDCLLFKTKR